MSFLQVIIIFLFIWISLNLIHLILTSCLVHPYLKIMHQFGIQIKPFFIGIYTTRLNYSLNFFIHSHKLWIKSWFNLGMIVTIILAPISFYLIIRPLINGFFEVKRDQSYNSLQPFLPGVNLPISELSYYIIALLVSSAFHELGHFAAAIREGLRVSRVGFLIFAIVPVALVEISEEAINQLSARARLRVITGGIWHNLVLGFILIIALLLNPYALSLFYETGQGVTVIDLKSTYSMTGPAGLTKGNVIVSFDDQCSVVDKISWKNCLIGLNSNPNLKYCVPLDFIEKEKFHSLNSKCCAEDSNKNLCFKDIENDLNHCLPVRPLLSSYSNTCDQFSNCSNNFKCIQPIPEKVGFKLIQIKRKNQASVLFWGYPFEIYEMITVIDYAPKYFWQPLLLIHFYETLLKYIIAFSLALAVINSIPCTFLDGKWLFKYLIENFLRDRFASNKIKVIELSVNIIGNILITSFILSSFINLFNDNVLSLKKNLV